MGQVLDQTTFQRVLVLSPHTDDGELGCGGSMARFVEEGKNVHYIAFSQAGLPELEPEMRSAMREIGVPPGNVLLLDFPTRHFPQHRQRVLQTLHDLNEQLKPDLVMMPTLGDLHQDHATVAAEGMRIFKRVTILCYEQPWNTVNLSTEAFVRLEERHIATKLKALESYESQRYRDYLNAEFIRGWAKTRGVQIGSNYAECFEVPRLIL